MLTNNTTVRNMQVEAKLLPLSVTPSFSVVLNVSPSTSSPHPPKPLIWQQSGLFPSHKAILITHWHHAGDPLHSHHCSHMWGGWLPAAWTSCWTHQCVCFSWLHVVLLFPGVSGVTVVTQKPVVAVTTGETVSIDCNLGTVTDRVARWYKQIPGGVPQFVLYYHHSHSSPTYGTGFSSPKFTSTHQSTTDYRLTIKNIEEGDSAVYYCNTWDDSVNEYVSQWFTLWQKPLHWVLLLFETLTQFEWSHQSISDLYFI